MSLDTTINLGIIATLKGSALDLGVQATVPYSRSYSLVLASGVGALQADKIWHDQRTLAGGTNEDLDLVGVLVDAFGVTFSPAKLKALLFSAAAANTTNLTISRPASNGAPFLAAAGDAIVLAPSGLFLLANPSAAAWALAAGTADLINVANAAGAAATYDVFAIATSA